MSTPNTKVLRIVFDNVPLFKDSHLEIPLVALDRVADKAQVFNIHKTIYTQKIIALAGVNASGKTSTLKLLYLGMAIVLKNTSLNECSYGTDFLVDNSKLTIDFFHDSCFYRLQSVIGVNSNDLTEQHTLYFKEEILYRKSTNDIHKKNDVFSFDETDIIRKRSTMEQEALSVLKDDDSIVITVTRNCSTALTQLFPFTDINLLAAPGATPSKVLHVFDPSLDMLNVNNNGGQFSYQVKFKDWSDPITLHSPLSLSNLVSSGTIKGQNLMSLIRIVLKSGGYIIVDELENHLNKELLRMITNLFKNEQINYFGACLIFTTHYTEILDFMDRKDNIFIARKNYQGITGIDILNYAHEVRRNDVKKSDVILSNYIRGTVPRYEDIQELEDSLCMEQTPISNSFIN